MKRIAHVDLFVTDVERSLAFYVGVLGFSVVEDTIAEIPSLKILTRGATDRIRLVLLKPPGGGDGDTLLELIQLQGEGARVPIRYGSAEGPLPSMWNYTVVVYDVEAVLADLADAGVAPATPIDVVPLPRLGTCRIVFVRDPDENLIELIDVVRPEE